MGELKEPSGPRRVPPQAARGNSVGVSSCRGAPPSRRAAPRGTYLVLLCGRWAASSGLGWQQFCGLGGPFGWVLRWWWQCHGQAGLWHWVAAGTSALCPGKSRDSSAPAGRNGCSAGKGLRKPTQPHVLCSHPTPHVCRTRGIPHSSQGAWCPATSQGGGDPPCPCAWVRSLPTMGRPV